MINFIKKRRLMKRIHKWSLEYRLLNLKLRKVRRKVEDKGVKLAMYINKNKGLYEQLKEETVINDKTEELSELLGKRGFKNLSKLFI